MTEASLAIARKVILCAGLLVSALLFLYPHWRVTFKLSHWVFEYDLGRGFITAPPLLEPGQVLRLTGFENNAPDAELPFFQFTNQRSPSYHIHRIRQITEVALALLFTFGLMRALKKPAGD